VHLHPLPSNLALPVGVGSCAAALLLRLIQRIRASRDRRKIVADLEKRRCKLLSLARARRSAILPAAEQTPIIRAYNVEFTDLEGDLGDSICHITTSGLRWNDDGIGPGLEVAAANLPEYGQNWRG
jgi:hypothetical protein